MFTISYYPAVKDDVANIGSKERKIIQRAIEKKLLHEPVLYGKPLQYSLRGLRSLRVGDYRVVFQLTGNLVYVILIAHRSIVYKEASKRTM